MKRKFIVIAQGRNKTTGLLTDREHRTVEAQSETEARWITKELYEAENCTLYQIFSVTNKDTTK